MAICGARNLMLTSPMFSAVFAKTNLCARVSLASSYSRSYHHQPSTLTIDPIAIVRGESKVQLAGDPTMSELTIGSSL